MAQVEVAADREAGRICVFRHQFSYRLKKKTTKQLVYDFATRSNDE